MNAILFSADKANCSAPRGGGGGGEDNKSNPVAKLRSFTKPIVLNFSTRMGFLGTYIEVFHIL